MGDLDDRLDAVAAELCAVAPADFTAERNARAAASEPDLAKRIRLLRKPVVSAWAVDLLVRDGGLDDALALAAELREAQDDLDAAELSRLGKQRRALVAGLARQAASAADEQDVAVSAAALTDIERTIDAAVRDATAAAAVQTARLVKPLEASGVDPIDPATLADAVAGTVPGVAAPPPRDDLAERRARKSAEKAARDAERTASEADRALGQAEAKLAKARDRADVLAERADELRAQLAQVESDAAAIDDDVARLEDERKALAKEATTARRAADAARGAAG